MIDEDRQTYALLDMGEDIDAVVKRYMAKAGLAHKQVADELRSIAQGWEDAA